MDSIRLLSPWDFPGKNTRVGNHSLLQKIFSAQGSNPDLLHCRQVPYRMSHQGSLPNLPKLKHNYLVKYNIWANINHFCQCKQHRILSYSVWAAIAKYHRLGGLTNRYLFLMVLDVEKPTIKFPGENMLLFAYTTFSLCPYMVEKERVLWFLFLFFEGS